MSVVGCRLAHPLNVRDPRVRGGGGRGRSDRSPRPGRFRRSEGEPRDVFCRICSRGGRTSPCRQRGSGAGEPGRGEPPRLLSTRLAASGCISSLGPHELITAGEAVKLRPADIDVVIKVQLGLGAVATGHPRGRRDVTTLSGGRSPASAPPCFARCHRRVRSSGSPPAFDVP